MNDRLPIRVLVVDDDAQVRKILVKIFSILAREVVATIDGHQAVALIQRERFDLIMTDLRMPGMGGEEVLIAARRCTPQVAVIVTSGFATEEDEARLRALGAELLHKPFNLSEVREATAKALGSAPRG